MFLIIILYIAYCGRLNNMAVISLQASLFFELWVQRARTEPDQWDLSAGEASQMQSLENAFPAVLRKGTGGDSW